MDDSNKAAKESLVSGWDGTDWFTLCATLLSIEIGSLLLSAAMLPVWIEASVLSAGLFVISSNPSATPFLALAGAFILFFMIKPNSNRQVSLLLDRKEKPFISRARGTLLVTTCFYILAIDFPYTPRIHSKCETYGKSMMDVGVGLFIAANGFVNRREDLAAIPKPVMSRIVDSLRSSALLLTLGFIRFWSIKSINYQEHVSEYGVHWNFFFTLSLLHAFSSSMQLNPSKSGAFGAILLIGHQFLLSFGLSDYVASSERSNILSMNKEGIISFPGYLALYELSVYFGHQYRQGRKSPKLYLIFAIQMIGIGLLFFVASVLSESSIELLSRKMVNAPYVFCMLCFQIIQVGMNLVGDLFLSFNGDSVLYSLNRNQMVLFLVANLMTGAVNISVDTLNSSPYKSFAVLFSYTLLLCFLSKFLGRYHIKLRL